MSTSIQIAVTTETPEKRADAMALAGRLNLPLIDLAASGGHPLNPLFLLVLTSKRLELRQTGPDAPGPVFVDFLSGPLRYRIEHGGGRKQPLGRAVGLKSGYAPAVLDATAGLARDAFVLACLGCRVRMVERSPILAALIEDGLKRAAFDPRTEPVIRQRMELIHGDGIRLIEKITPAALPDVIFLDPMYPKRTKSALVKKEMRILKTIVGDDQDAPLLLAAALKKALNRVVVKRPALAQAISGPRPTLQIRGKTSRFDVYLTKLPQPF